MVCRFLISRDGIYTITSVVKFMFDALNVRQSAGARRMRLTICISDFKISDITL